MFGALHARQNYKLDPQELILLHNQWIRVEQYSKFQDDCPLRKALDLDDPYYYVKQMKQELFFEAFSFASVLVF